MEPTGRSFPQLVALVVGGSLAAMWIVEILDSFAFNDGLQAHGIEPRQIDGLEGVVFAPVLHGGWTHLISNSVPFLVLGALVMSYGLPRWIKATGFIT
ncbi:MAG: rhomboid family intramembrane serine protease, partial [Acidimicrobiia bacterium]|nr:rhomboid family intramembrane serine protease [Acidimicrobiia bacterium]